MTDSGIDISLFGFNDALSISSFGYFSSEGEEGEVGGQLTLGGECGCLVSYVDLATGQILLSGQSICLVNFISIGTGGFTTSGIGNCLPELLSISNGSIIIGGEALCDILVDQLEQTAEGGIVISGESVLETTLIDFSTGFVVLGGAASCDVNVGILSGGVVAFSGEALCNINMPLISNGAIAISGSASYSVKLTVVSNGSINIGGNSSHISSIIEASGSIVLGGESETTYETFVIPEVPVYRPPSLVGADHVSGFAGFGFSGGSRSFKSVKITLYYTDKNNKEQHNTIMNSYKNSVALELSNMQKQNSIKPKTSISNLKITHGKLSKIR